MRIFGWAEAFEEKRTCENVLMKVHRTEITYWIWLLVCIALGLGGWAMILSAPSNDIKAHAIGLFLAVDGMIGVATIKIWVHIRLCMFWTLWLEQNRLEEEMRRSEAADL